MCKQNTSKVCSNCGRCGRSKSPAIDAASSEPAVASAPATTTCRVLAAKARAAAVTPPVAQPHEWRLEHEQAYATGQ